MEQEWVVVESFTSEAEARVVESFLRANGFAVQLLDTHAPYRIQPTAGLIADGGMRMLARAEDLAAIKQILVEGQKPTHLEVMGELQPVYKSRYEKWILGLMLIVILLLSIISRH